MMESREARSGWIGLRCRGCQRLRDDSCAAVAPVFAFGIQVLARMRKSRRRRSTGKRLVTDEKRLKMSCADALGSPKRRDPVSVLPMGWSWSRDGRRMRRKSWSRERLRFVRASLGMREKIVDERRTSFIAKSCSSCSCCCSRRSTRSAVTA